MSRNDSAPIFGFQAGATLDRQIAPWKESIDSLMAGYESRSDTRLQSSEVWKLLSLRVAAGSDDAALHLLGAVDEEKRIDRQAKKWFDEISTRLPTESPPVELLPYILDPHAVATRLRVRRDGDRAKARRVRKKSGAFFTPPDLADHMVETALRNLDIEGVILDPSCGTGVFLASALRWMAANISSSPGKLLSHLRGIDIDPSCVFSARLVLAAEVARLNGDTLDVHWDATRPCFEVRNGLMDSDDTTNVNAVIMNPPYGALGPEALARVSHTSLALSVPMTPGTPTYVPFLVRGFEIVRSSGARLVGVVPLALASNTSKSFSSLRRFMQDSATTLKFSFFDRTPDALFGDHVKTRACIVESEPGPSGIAVTPLLRWASTGRRELFASIRHTPLPTNVDISDSIPRLSSSADVESLKRMEQWGGGGSYSLEKMPRSGGSLDSRQVLVAGTAYNWIPALRGPILSVPGDSASSSHLLTFATVALASAGFAILTSRILYWRWASTSDAFHVSRKFLAQLPWPSDPDQILELAEAGDRIWDEMRRFPTTSVNKGKETVSYDPEQASMSRNRVDEILGEALGIDPTFTRDLERWNLEHRRAGRTLEFAA